MGNRVFSDFRVGGVPNLMYATFSPSNFATNARRRAQLWSRWASTVTHHCSVRVLLGIVRRRSSSRQRM